MLHGVLHGGGREFGEAQLVLVVALARARRLDVAALRRDVEQRLGQGDTALPINGGVMNLAIDSRLPAFEPFEHVGFPERPAAVEKRGVQTAAILLKLFQGAGLGKHDTADMIFEVDVVIVDPDRVRHFEWHLRQLTLEH